jgi:dTDP-4-dehydrorhamnose reductase
MTDREPPPVRLLVTGAGGMLGQDVMRAAGDDAVGLTRSELDVTDAGAVTDAVRGFDVVINCAAWTDVDGAEEHPNEAMLANRDGARHVAAAARRVVHVSTDYVFDGTASRPYVESDIPRPLQEYGRSKLAGELAVAAANPDHVIVRSSWLFGAGGANFVATMLRLGDERDELRVVDDQVGCPTFTGHLAEGLVRLAGSGDRGVRHLAGRGSCSWYEFAREIFARSGVDCRLEPCTTAEFPRPAVRPANSVLASEHGGYGLPTWQEGLEDYLGVRA